jgi:hypothetical protein
MVSFSFQALEHVRAESVAEDEGKRTTGLHRSSGLMRTNLPTGTLRTGLLVPGRTKEIAPTASKCRVTEQITGVEGVCSVRSA